MRRMFRATRWFVTLGVVVLGSLAPAWAQSTATLQGTITDTQSAVMPGVSVTIRNQATGIERATVIGHDWGGWVAFLLGLHQADRIERMVSRKIDTALSRDLRRHIERDGAGRRSGGDR